MNITEDKKYFINNLYYLNQDSNINVLPNRYIMLLYDPDIFVPIFPIIIANAAGHITDRMNTRSKYRDYHLLFDQIQKGINKLQNTNELKKNIIINVTHNEQKIYIIAAQISQTNCNIKIEILDKYVKPYIDEKSKKFINDPMYNKLRGNTPMEKYLNNVYLVKTILAPNMEIKYKTTSRLNITVNENNKIKQLSDLLYECIINSKSYPTIVKEYQYNKYIKKEFELPDIVKGRIYLNNNRIKKRPKIIIDEVDLDNLVMIDMEI